MNSIRCKWGLTIQSQRFYVRKYCINRYLPFQMIGAGFLVLEKQ